MARDCRTRSAVALVVVVAASWLGGACASRGSIEDLVAPTRPPAPAAPAPTTAATSGPNTTSAATTTAGRTTSPPPAATVDALLAQLVVAPEAGAGTYDRDRFDHWIDADGDGCHTRCEVLAEERRTDLPGLAAGWRSIYDGYTTDDPAELQVDHVVALAEAWRSGADGWDDDRRRAFANDLEEPDALVAVTAATNQAKGDKDPAEWQPPRRQAWCQWGLGWLRTKVRWGLTADGAEVEALGNILRGC
jgi:hypothetical protein